MITLYQESVPFSNKMFDGQISQDKKFTNPVIIPYASNAALGEDVLETVIYIKNDDQSRYYKNIVISLMKEASGVAVPSSGTLQFTGGGALLSLNSTLNLDADIAYDYPGGEPGSLITMQNSYMSTYRPVVSMEDISVKFSYGYDELSLLKWEGKKSILVIPMIGTSGLGDTSYIPVRMRITLKSQPGLITNRDYFIDVSYSDELIVGS